MALQQLLIPSVVLGLAAGAFAAILRACPWPAGWTTRKPLGCPLCMGWWTGFAFWLFTHGVARADGIEGLAPMGQWLAVVQLLVVVAVASWLNAQVIPPVVDFGDLESKE